MTPQQIAASQRVETPPVAPLTPRAPAQAAPPPPPPPPAPPAHKEAPAREKKNQPIGWWIALGVLFIFNLTVFGPWRAFFFESELESSWILGLHWAWLKGLDFGHDFIFTYGPWGFLFQGYHPDTFRIDALGWTVFTAAFFAGMVQLAQHLTPKRWASAIFIVLTTAIAGITIPGIQEEVRLLMIAWLLLVLSFYVDPKPLSIPKGLIVFAMALGSLGKFSVFLVSILVLGAVTLEQVLRKKIPWLLILYAIFTPLLWLAAGQSPLSIIPYLRHASELAGAFGQAMSIPGPTDMRDIICFAIVAILFLGMLGFAHFRERDAGDSKYWMYKSILAVGSLAALLLMTFKMGFVRHDGHELLCTMPLLLLSLVYAAAWWPKMTGAISRGTMVGFVVLCFAIAWYSDNRWTERGLPTDMLETVTLLPSRIGTIASMLVGGIGPKTDFDNSLEKARAMRPVPVVKGSVDVYAWGQRAVFAHGMTLNSRPVMQSYAAYTAELSKLNADFLRGPNAPDSILFDLQTLDGRYPALEDAASWPVLLSRYELKDASSSELLFQKSAQPGDYVLSGTHDVEAKIGQWVGLPSITEPVWAAIKLRPTLTGKLLNTVYHPPALQLLVKTQAGGTAVTRLIPDIARGGFLLSPMVIDRVNFAFLGATDWTQRMRGSVLTQMQIIVEGATDGGSAFDDEYTITFSTIQFPHHDISAVPGIQEYVDFKDFLSRMSVARADVQPQLLATAQGRSVVMSPPNTQLLVRTAPDANSMQVEFGVLGSTTSQQVHFKVYALTPGTNNQVSAQVIWSRDLNPKDSASARTPQSAIIGLPSPVPSAILLETTADPAGTDCMPYWARAAFRH